nr:hypothetical protein DO63_5918 [Burkholderia pseudomallei]
MKALTLLRGGVLVVHFRLSWRTRRCVIFRS